MTRTSKPVDAREPARGPAMRKARRDVPIALGAIALASLGMFQNCAGPGGGVPVAASVQEPKGLRSPFASDKVQLGRSFSGGAANKADASSATIPAGTELAFVVVDSCLSERRALPDPKPKRFIDKYLTDAYWSQGSGPFDESAVVVALRSPIAVSDLRRAAQADRCVVGVANAQRFRLAGAAASAPSYDDSGFPEQAPYLNQIGFGSADAFFAENAPASFKANVAVIDTGFDSSNEDAGPAVLNAKGAGVASSDDVSRDSDGHGTGVASVIAARGGNGRGVVGVAWRNARLIPIRLFSRAASPGSPRASSAQIFQAVRAAVNAGADVVNMSFSIDSSSLDLSDPSFECDALAGHAIYRGIKSGAFFSIAAGNWTRLSTDASGNPVGVPGEVSAPRFGAAPGAGPGASNSAPACWGLAYKGAVTVGALQTGTTSLALFSNWGSRGVEIAAPGSRVRTYGLANQAALVDGTSVAAAQVSAAAALAIAYHKARGWAYTPWMMEDLLLASSARSSALENPADGRAVRGGATLDLAGLARKLDAIASLSNLERLRLATDNPDDGFSLESGGGGPGSSSLVKLSLYSSASVVDSVPGSRLQMQAAAYFANGSYRVVTGDPGVAYSVLTPALATVDAKGVLYPEEGAAGVALVTASYGGKTAMAAVSIGGGESRERLALQSVRLSLGLSPGGAGGIVETGSDQWVNLCVAPSRPSAAPSAQVPLSSGVGADRFANSAQALRALGRDSEGAFRNLGSPSTASQLAAYLSAQDGSPVASDDVGGVRLTLTLLFGREKASFPIEYAKLPAVELAASPQETVTRGQYAQLRPVLRTSGTCSAFALDPSQSNPAIAVDEAGRPALASIVNPTFNVAVADLESVTSPQPALNALLNGKWSNAVTVGSALPAGDYEVNAVFRYRGGGAETLVPMTTYRFKLVEPAP